VVNIRKLLWDAGNISHIARHDVTVDEVEEACQGSPVVQQGKKGRLLIYGTTISERMLTVVLDPEEESGIYYPVTARSSSKKERKIYAIEKGGEEK